MIKKGLFYTGIIVVIVFINTAFKPFEKEIKTKLNSTHPQLFYEYPSLKQSDYQKLNLPFKGKFFIGFKDAIAFKESQGNYHLVNSLGYLGKYQFGKTTLETLGITDSLKFMNTPKLQEKAFIALLKRNKWELRNEINQYNGTIINGVRITESGILAAAHLGGAGSVRKFLQSNGTKIFKDNYGTSIKDYLEKFGGYETQNLVADNNARVR